MSERIDEFPPVRVAVVTFTSVEPLAAHRRHLDLQFPLLADPDRAVYRQFGLGRGAFTEVWSLDTLRLYGDLLRRGRKLRRPIQDTRQLGGDFVIDREGRLVAAFRPQSPSSRPSVDDLRVAVGRAG